MITLSIATLIILAILAAFGLAAGLLIILDLITAGALLHGLFWML